MSFKISVITISYNEEKVIEKTIQSVINQTYSEYEYILIDGGSNDKTIEIAENYSSKITHFISEPDKGIYDAMNKGINYASGDYIIFMNSGDIFNNIYTLSDIFSNDINSDVIYGNTSYLINEKQVLVKASKLNRMWFRLPFCHQSVFVKSEIMKKFYFDTKYEIIADFNFFYKLYIERFSFYYVDKIFSICNIEGISNNPDNRIKISREREEIIGFYFNFYYECYKRLKNIIKQSFF
jgi:glycosyltransferase involved in cell wall biosynthesis